MLSKLIKGVWIVGEESLNICKRIGRGLSIVYWNNPVPPKWLKAWMIFVMVWLVASAEDVVSPTLPPAPPRYPDLKKGAWFVTIWDIDGDGTVDIEIKDEETDKKIKPLDYIISTLKKAHVDWVAIKLGDGWSFYLAKGRKLTEWLENQGYLEKEEQGEDPEERERKACKAFEKVIAEFNENGIYVLGWHFVYGIPNAGPDKTGGTPEQEAEVSNKILNLTGISGLIIDPEEEYKSPGAADRAIDYMERVRKAHPDSFIAYSTYPFFYLHSDFPYKEFGYYCNAFMPQCYWGQRFCNPDEEMRRWQTHLNVQYLEWWQSPANEKEDVVIKPRDAVKPVLPVGMSYTTPEGRKTTPDEIKKFCEIAWQYGYQISIFRAEKYYSWNLEAMGPKNSEKWKAYAKDPDVIAKGLQFLRRQQRNDGSWSRSVGITALSVLCLLNAGCGPGDPTVIRGIQYILNNVKDDGSITNSNNVVYETSLSLLALVARQLAISKLQKDAKESEDLKKLGVSFRDADYEKIENIINKARKFLEEVQRDEDHGFSENDWQYGGFGYEKLGTRSRPDLSNTQFAVIALATAYDYLSKLKDKFELNDKSEWCYKAIVFVGRCRNPDGGFTYLPGQSDAKSYGSMTAAGIWCLRLCGVSEQDDRVKAALQWLKNNEDLAFDDNPGLGTVRFLHYYYMTFAKALLMCSPAAIPGWYEALRQVLERRQDANKGYWRNPPELKDWEDNPDLATAFAILALQAPTVVREAWTTLILSSSADLHVYDPHGRHIGKNYETGEFENEIPNASFDVDAEGNQIITLRSLESGTYRIELFGTDTGEYLLTINGYVDDSLISSQKFGKSIRKGQTHVGRFTVATVVGPLTIYAEEPLPVPSGLVAQAGDRFVDLIWESYTEPGFELVGYNVYRSESKGGEYRKINSEPIRQTWFRDTDVVNGVTYYYAITAVDRTGNETERSRYVKATPSTAAPPLITILIAPNPVGNDGGIFLYNLPSGTREARIVIFDITGRPLIEIPLDVNGRRYPATGRWNPVDKNGIPLANGPYIYVLIADGKVIGQGKMVIQR